MLLARHMQSIFRILGWVEVRQKTTIEVDR